MRNPPRIFSNDENKWIMINYPIHGTCYCAEKLLISFEQMRNKISRMKLHKSSKINIELFKNINTKEVAYIMGIVWADGYISKKSKICIGLKEIDMIFIKNIFMITGDWNYRIVDMSKYGNYKKQGIIDIGDQELHKIFYKYDYINKSYISPNKLLENIPENIKHYFFRGLVDGDGCFYINKKHYTYQFALVSTLYQDWSYMIELCNKLKIKYRVDKTNKEKSKSSMFRICRKKDIIIFGDYIYSGDFFGFERKFNKFKEIKNYL